jgi:hypothetical protein
MSEQSAEQSVRAELPEGGSRVRGSVRERMGKIPGGGERAAHDLT